MVKVSVVIPTHRVNNWLDEAVLSVLSSSDVDFNIVVVINGTDMIPKATWIQDPRVILFHTSDKLGPTEAMLTGIKLADSSYIARLDSDDLMSKERLSQQVSYLDDHIDTHIVGSLVQRISEDGSDMGIMRIPSGSDVRRELILTNILPHSSVMMRRSTLEEIGNYNPAITQMEDYDVILRFALQGKVAILPQILTYYRVHNEQISRGAQPNGEHINIVLRGKTQLGALLGEPKILNILKNTLWRIVQYTRYYKITKPGHEY